MARAAHGETLSTRALNRALLARQLLLERRDLPVFDVVHHLAGMQAQVPSDPYIALWSRIAAFEPAELEELLLARNVARAPLMRSTIHLATAQDCLTWRPLVQPVLRRGLQSAFGKRLAGVDFDELEALGGELLTDRPRTFAELRSVLISRWPGADPAGLGYSVSYLLPLVQLPPRGLWQKSGQPNWLLTTSWLGQPMAENPEPAGMILRYLAAFGPASVGDAQAWCGLTRLREHFERLRPQLVTFSDERGRELFDLPDAPRPGAETPAPVRFLPQYDNVFLGHAVRTRIVSDADRKVATQAGNGYVSTVLVDGFIAATWKLERDGNDGTLRVSPFAPWTPEQNDAAVAEGRNLAGFLAPDLDSRDIVIEQPAQWSANG